MKKKYVLVGASGRAYGMFAQPMLDGDISEYCEIVGIFDINPLRMEKFRQKLGLTCPAYTDFDKMIAETKPDCGIITTKDCYHHHYAIKCLEAGMDVVTEKPMTIDADKCNALLEAEQRTGKKVTVTFNYRFAPFVTQVKQLLRDGVIGDILNIDFEYLLDTSHGADYFRRWHRMRENSGSLLVHKATHHFDLINWWLEEEPMDIMGYGTRRFYGPTRENRGERCLTCDHKKTCEFYWDITADEFTREFYYECESADGYIRDMCVFADEINIPDTMSVNVKYSGGALLSYSLITHCPYEGWKASINGTKGRIEAAEYHSGLKAGDPAYYIDVYDRNRNKIEWTMPKAGGGHGGGDERLRQMIFVGGVPDPLGHMAGSYQGALSILVGICALKSMDEGINIRPRDLVDLDKYKK